MAELDAHNCESSRRKKHRYVSNTQNPLRPLWWFFLIRPWVQNLSAREGTSYVTVFLNARALAAISTAEMTRSAATGSHKSKNVAPRITIPRAILM